jgi:hypothetical protein
LKRATLLLLLALARPVLASDELGEFIGFLETNGVAVDRARAVQGAVEGVLKAVDPKARFCSTADVAAIEEGGTAGPAGTNSSVDAIELWPEKLAYLKLRGLRPGSGEEALAHMRPLSGDYGIIVDLRGADGFDLDSAVCLASPFRCPGDVLFTLNDLAGNVVTSCVVREGAPIKVSLMVLIDQDTRNAAETVAALWSGCPGVMLIGAPTHGDSHLRQVLTLPDGRRLHVATRRVIPASGRDYEGVGVRPDIEVTASGGSDLRSRDTGHNGKPLSDKSRQDRNLMARVEGDAALRRATDILLGLRALSIHGQH